MARSVQAREGEQGGPTGIHVETEEQRQTLLRPNFQSSSSFSKHVRSLVQLSQGRVS